MSSADHQERGEGWIRSGPTKFPCHRNACRGLLCSKLLSPVLGSDSAALPTRERAHKQTSARFNCSHPQRRQHEPWERSPCRGRAPGRQNYILPLDRGFLQPLGWKHQPCELPEDSRDTNPTTLNPLTANTPSSPYSQSASAHTMQGFFPPSSNVTLLRLLLEAASLISFPTCTVRHKQDMSCFP